MSREDAPTAGRTAQHFEDADIAAMENHATAHKLPIGWLMLYFGLIAWGVYYFVAYTPAISGWTQSQEVDEEAAAAAAAAEKQAEVPAEQAPEGQPAAPKGVALDATNPLAGNADAIEKGHATYDEICEECHAEKGAGDIGPALNDKAFLYKPDDVADGYYYRIIHDGTEQGFAVDGFTPEGGMPPYGNQFDDEKIWAVIAYIRTLQP